MGFLLVVPAMIVRGLVLMALWGWFIVPFGLPGLTLAWAIGISLIVGFLTADVKPDPDRDLLVSMVMSMAFSVLAFIVGAIVQIFM